MANRGSLAVTALPRVSPSARGPQRIGVGDPPDELEGARTACGGRRWRTDKRGGSGRSVVGTVKDDLLVNLLERLEGVQSLEYP